VAEAVVDGLEVVDVGEDQADRAAQPLRAGDLARERLVGLAPVRQPGEPVDERLALDHPVEPRVLEGDDGLSRQ
jgi:hypothetical protein